jgi:DNA invertase Pin-like site-specific DNA recombinase
MDTACKLVRVSSDAQDEHNQDAEVDRHIEANGYEVTREIRLHDVSAYKGQHAPELDSILEDVRAGKFTVVVVAHSSRIDRRDPDVAMLWSLQVRMAGGRVESVREPESGRGDLGGRIMTMLAQESNHAYSKSIGDNVRAAQARSRANGAFVSGAVPFGYSVAGERYGKTLEPNADGLRIIPEVYARIIDGQSLGAVAAWATGELGRGIWAATIAGWVRNPVYSGHLCKRASQTVNTVWGPVLMRVPAIVDVHVWSAAQAELDSRKIKPGTRKGSPMPLTGILSCGNCGSPMYRIKIGDGKMRYRCNGSGPTGTKRGCGNLVSMEIADALADRLVSTMTIPVQAQILIRGKNHEAEIHDLMLQLQGLNLRDKADRARQAEILDEVDRLEGLETTPDRVELMDTDQTVGDEYDAVPESERNAWLRSHGITFTAQNSRKFPKSPMWDIDAMEPGMRRSRAAEGSVTMTVTYRPGRMLKPARSA